MASQTPVLPGTPGQPVGPAYQRAGRQQQSPIRVTWAPKEVDYIAKRNIAAGVSALLDEEDLATLRAKALSELGYTGISLSALIRPWLPRLEKVERRISKLGKSTTFRGDILEAARASWARDDLYSLLTVAKGKPAAEAYIMRLLSDLDRLDGGYNPYNWAGSLMLNVASEVPGVARFMFEWELGAKEYQIAAAAIGAAIPLPEEILTIPVATLAGAGRAFQWLQRRSEGQLYANMLRRGVDRDIASSVSFWASIPYAGAELAQYWGIGKLGRLVSKPLAGAITKAGTSQTAKAVGHGLMRFVGGVLEESLEESVQRGVEIIGENTAAFLHNRRHPDQPVWAFPLSRLPREAGEAFTESIATMAVLSLMSGGVQLPKALSEVKKGVSADRAKRLERNVMAIQEMQAAPTEVVEKIASGDASRRGFRGYDAGLAMDPSRAENRAAYKRAADYVARQRFAKAARMEEEEEQEEQVRAEATAVRLKTSQIYESPDAPKFGGMDWFLHGLKGAFPSLGAQELSAIRSLVKARAEVRGISPEEYISRRFVRFQRLPESMEEAARKRMRYKPGIRLHATTEFMEGGRAVIRAFESGNLRSALHELAHVFRRDMTRAEADAFAEWANAKLGIWSRQAEEKFAKGMVQYLRTGEAPTVMLTKTFAKMKQWLRALWRGVQDEVDLPDNVKRGYAVLFGHRPPPASRPPKGRPSRTEIEAAVRRVERALAKEKNPARQHELKAKRLALRRRLAARRARREALVERLAKEGYPVGLLVRFVSPQAGDQYTGRVEVTEDGRAIVRGNDGAEYALYGQPWVPFPPATQELRAGLPAVLPAARQEASEVQQPRQAPPAAEEAAETPAEQPPARPPEEPSLARPEEAQPTGREAEQTKAPGGTAERTSAQVEGQQRTEAAARSLPRRRRTTPAPGTPEREALDRDYTERKERADRLLEEYRQALEEYGSAPPDAVALEAAMRKLQEASDRYEKALADLASVSPDWTRARLEDIVRDRGNPARLAAYLELHRAELSARQRSALQERARRFAQSRLMLIAREIEPGVEGTEYFTTAQREAVLQDAVRRYAQDIVGTPESAYPASDVRDAIGRRIREARMWSFYDRLIGAVNSFATISEAERVNLLEDISRNKADFKEMARIAQRLAELRKAEQASAEAEEEAEPEQAAEGEQAAEAREEETAAVQAPQEKEEAAAKPEGAEAQQEPAAPEAQAPSAVDREIVSSLYGDAQRKIRALIDDVLRRIEGLKSRKAVEALWNAQRSPDRRADEDPRLPANTPKDVRLALSSAGFMPPDAVTWLTQKGIETVEAMERLSDAVAGSPVLFEVAPAKVPRRRRPLVLTPETARITDKGVMKLLFSVSASSKGPDALRGVLVEKDVAVATDGLRLHWRKGNTGVTENHRLLRDGTFRPEREYSDAPFPAWRDAIPKRARRIGTIDVATEWARAKAFGGYEALISGKVPPHVLVPLGRGRYVRVQYKAYSDAMRFLYETGVSHGSLYATTNDAPIVITDGDLSTDGTGVVISPFIVPTLTREGTQDPGELGNLAVGRVYYEAHVQGQPRISDVAQELAPPAPGTTTDILADAEESPPLGRKEDLSESDRAERERLVKAIDAEAAEKKIEGAEYRRILRQTTGVANLNRIYNLELLHRALVAFREEWPRELVVHKRGQRPKTVKVIRRETAERIRNARALLMSTGALTEERYQEILRKHGAATDTYISNREYITEAQAQKILYSMWRSAPWHLKLHRAVTGLEEKNPDAARLMRAMIADMEAEAQARKEEGKPVKLFWGLYKAFDMRMIASTIARKSGRWQFMHLVQEMINTYQRGEAWAANMLQPIIDSIGRRRFVRVVRLEDKNHAVENWLINQNPYYHKKIERGEPGWEIFAIPSDMTRDQETVAMAIQDMFTRIQNDVRAGKFRILMDLADGDLDKMLEGKSEWLPDAPDDAIEEGMRVFHEGGWDALRPWLDQQYWGVIHEGYTPTHGPIFYMFGKPTSAVKKGHFHRRDGLSFQGDRRQFFAHLSSYLYQVYTKVHMQPLIDELEEEFDRVRQAIPLADERGVARTLDGFVREVTGQPVEMGPIGRMITRLYSRAMSTILLRPHIMFRNALQTPSLASHPGRWLAPGPPLSDDRVEYLRTMVLQDQGIRQDWLMLMQKPFVGMDFAIGIAGTSSPYLLIDSKLNRARMFRGEMNALDKQFASGLKGDEVISKTAAVELTKGQQLEALLQYGEGGEEAFKRYVAKETVNDVQVVYGRAQVAPLHHGAAGRILMNLVNFQRQYLQRLALHAYKLMPGSSATLAEKYASARLITAVIARGYLVGLLYLLITGKKRHPYALWEMVQWQPGGLFMSSAREIAETVNAMIQVATGDVEARDRLIRHVTNAAETLVPFYYHTLQFAEALTGTENVDRLFLRQVRAQLERRYRVVSRNYRVKRDFVEAMQKALFGSRTAEPKRRAEPRPLVSVGAKLAKHRL